jgi:hypothetical protein
MLAWQEVGHPVFPRVCCQWRPKPGRRVGNIAPSRATALRNQDITASAVYLPLQNLGNRDINDQELCSGWKPPSLAINTCQEQSIDDWTESLDLGIWLLIVHWHWAQVPNRQPRRWLSRAMGTATLQTSPVLSRDISRSFLPVRRPPPPTYSTVVLGIRATPFTTRRLPSRPPVTDLRRMQLHSKLSALYVGAGKWIPDVPGIGGSFTTATVQYSRRATGATGAIVA